MSRAGPAVWFNAGVKFLLLGLLLVAVLFPDLPQWEGKGMNVRAAFFPLATLVIPAIWWFRGRPSPYPHVVDGLIALPFLVDVAGNALDLYDPIEWFDDLAHALNWVFLVAAFTGVLSGVGIGRLNAFALGVGFGATAEILWELAEYMVQESGTGGLNLTYEDTIGDLVLSFSGGVVGALIVVTLLWDKGVAGGLFGARSR